MNLIDFYNSQQVFDLMGFKHRMQATRWRDKYRIKYIFICGKPFYWRVSVNAHLSTLGLSKFEIADMTRKQLRYNLSTDEYLPRCMALEFIEMGKTALYDRTGFLGSIRTKRVYGFLWFNRKDLYDFLVEKLSIAEAVAKRSKDAGVVTVPQLPYLKEWFRKNYE